LVRGLLLELGHQLRNMSPAPELDPMKWATALHESVHIPKD